MSGQSRKRSQSAASRAKARRGPSRGSKSKGAAEHPTENRRRESFRRGEHPRDGEPRRFRPRFDDQASDAFLYERSLFEGRKHDAKGLTLQQWLGHAVAATAQRLSAMTAVRVDQKSSAGPARELVAPTFAPKFAPSRSYRPETETTPSAKKIPSGAEQPEPASKSPPQQAHGASDAKPNDVLVLDAWQRQAFDHLLAGQHVIVDAPTSAGKTRVIEALLDAQMDAGLRLIYTSPVKSLSNDKYREFAQRYGRERVGINTGDFKENLGAPIILATLETYRNSLLGLEPDISRRMVVYDEYHYLQDESRGSAWEESMILTPKGSQLILLSASVPNAEEFAAWIERITGRQTAVVRVTKRPVPLVDVVHTPAGWILADELKLSPKELDTLGNLFVAEKRRLRRQPRDRRYYAAMLARVVDALELDLGPIVVYAARRAEVETLAAAMMRALSAGTAPKWSPEGSSALKARIQELPGWEYVPSELQSMVQRYGVAFHHSGMIPPARVAIESLLKEGLLRVCMGTMGISLGVNFAVRSAFIADETRPGESGETAYSNSEILQMLGRAGRRGHDVQGFSLWSDWGKYARFRPRERERCVSSLKFDPSTVLGLIDRTNSYVQLADFYKKSLFMQGQPPSRVLVFDHDSLSAEVHRATEGATQSCTNIPKTFLESESGKKRTQVACTQCVVKKTCHELVRQSRNSLLQRIVGHLEDVGAVDDQRLTNLGRFARNFPQAGGLLIASWLASGAMKAETFTKYAHALAVFCSAHFKEIPPIHVDQPFLHSLRIDTEIEFYYPSDLFPEYYDEVKNPVDEYASPLVFRELNFGAPSIVQAWLNPKMSWEKLVEQHTTRFFSAGDCMMVLFRFATYLQSCARLGEHDPGIVAQARRMLAIVLREPLDARNRMLIEEVESEERLDPELGSLDPELSSSE